MRIVLYSPNFYPLIGGVERVVLDLAFALTKQNHSVKVITLTPAPEPDSFPFVVIREAGFWQTVRHIRWGQVFVQLNVSLKGIIPYLFSNRPLVLTHHNRYDNTVTGRLKQLTVGLARVNTACSEYIMRYVPGTVLLPNPYQDDLFRYNVEADRSYELIFVGRLVSVKGCDVAVRSLQVLREQYGLTPALTIVGSGPEKPALEALVHELALQDQVQFVGQKTGQELVQLLNNHQVMVVPSVYEEPFGRVALEGIACGCLVVGPASGGLPEAIGPCGVTFPAGNVLTLAGLLEKALTEPSWRTSFRQYVAEHLRKHSRAVVAADFISMLASVTNE